MPVLTALMSQGIHVTLVIPMMTYPKRQGLYDPDFEKDACGIGLVCQVQGLATHRTIEDGILILKNLSHRGAAGADSQTGDGAGILTQIPWSLFEAEFAASPIQLPARGDYGVGMVFLPKDPSAIESVERLFAEQAESLGCRVVTWRDVPVDSSRLGAGARKSEPRIRQFFVTSEADLEARLFAFRRQVESRASQSEEFYIASLSSRTLVYKGLLLPEQLAEYYLDLRDPRFVSAIALVHSRFSTNTFPSWSLAHPFRYLCHNGEINTLKGNLNWMRARQGDSRQTPPIVRSNQSDSACLDNALEYLVMGGRSIPHALSMLIPEPWTSNVTMDLNRRAFFEYHAAIMEPWDGPAAVICTDGRTIAASLDRNGLRPCRYVIAQDPEHTAVNPQATRLILSSEAGVLPLDPTLVIERGRLKPGRMLVVDLERGELLSDETVKGALAHRKPYRNWVAEHRITLSELPEPDNIFRPLLETLRGAQNVFGYTEEELRMILAPMAIHGEEPISSMGIDTPLPVLSPRPRLLFDYFKQLFAQVTNPPIDPIREHLVMSLAAFIGPKSNIHSDEPKACNRINLKHPILTNTELEKIRQIDDPSYTSKTLPMVFPVRDGVAGLQKALDRLCADAVNAVKGGYKLLILSDRPENALFVPIPSLLAVAAVHETLIAASLRTETGLLVESGEPREVHHFACLIGYGAGAINPYVALDSLTALSKAHDLPQGIDPETAHSKYIAAISKGLLKVFSKMGISAIQSYCGAQLFEAIGIGPKLRGRYFSGTASRIGGIEIEHLAEDALARHQRAHARPGLGGPALEPGGSVHFRAHGEPHLWNPRTITALQKAARSGTEGEAHQSYAEFARLANEEGSAPTLLRSLLTFAETGGAPVPLDEVEPATEIVKRFTTGAMSLGAISEEAHRTLAIAMNRLGGKSNTGEGGEDPARFRPMPNGDSANSAIKQVASARFGVTTHYLVNARELQIKVAQGAKPGEGGQLPGHKVDRHIAWLRHSTPGVQLISPPPHHDIYSIEDLAQLISDLKHVNPSAKVSVKLVSEVGVGTIAAGVVKAGADKVLISGDTGGTGASPLSSIQHAGSPWELGLAETQQTLKLNGLRDRVRLETDGQLRTGRDVAIAALLGAEEFGFATAPLIVEGCMMMRKCHLNTCPVGVATQDPVLRARFSGQPEYLIRYFMMVAEDLRGIMAKLGFKSVTEMVGRVDRLKQRTDLTGRAACVDLSALLVSRERTAVAPAESQSERPRPGPDDFAAKIASDCAPAIERGEKVSQAYLVRNVHRSIGAHLSGLIAQRHGAQGLPEGTIHLRLTGSAGQSFGAFAVKGLEIELEGEANDYIGKGLSGGRLIVYPPAGSHLSAESIIVGNTAFYGATAGEAYIAGVAGERFGVRNSGARIVVEGVGDHGCEYMTGGRVVILGKIGRNFAAGMSGGIAYILDEDGTTRGHCNLSMVDFEPLQDESEIREVHGLVENHARLTGSRISKTIIEDWEQARRKFVKIIPTEYRAALQAAQAQSHEEEASV